MKTTQTLSRHPDLSAEEIINDLISIEDPNQMREDLHELFIAFFLHFDRPSPDFKDRVFNTYTALRKMLNQCSAYQVEKEVTG
ncbi:hypothetical protein AAG747_15470 [Rapidithrix thailandica]|uniref:Uncharacterized protein n=1 Tax=Rapidithrix thailandica TaxID=413964 RepID=A0AAW9S623_9BACT